MTDTKSITLNITDIPPPEVEFKTDGPAVSEISSQIVIREDIDTLSNDQQVILVAKSNFTDANSTFSLSGNDANKFEINNIGEVRAKDLSNASSSGGINFDNQNRYDITITESRPDESDGVQSFTLLAQNTEEDAASVNRYSAAFNSSTRQGFKASADRGQVGSADNGSIRESILTHKDINTNVSVSSVQSLGHIKEENSKTLIFTNTVENGKNEHNVESSDWKYEFPIETNNQKESNNFYAPYHKTFNKEALLAPQDNNPNENVAEQVIQSSYFSGGTGIQTVLTHKLNSSGLGKLLPFNFLRTSHIMGTHFPI